VEEEVVEKKKPKPKVKATTPNPPGFPAVSRHTEGYGLWVDRYKRKYQAKLPTGLPDQTFSRFTLYDPVSNQPLRSEPLLLNKVAVIKKEQKEGRARAWPPTQHHRYVVLAAPGKERQQALAKEAKAEKAAAKKPGAKKAAAEKPEPYELPTVPYYGYAPSQPAVQQPSYIQQPTYPSYTPAYQPAPQSVGCPAQPTYPSYTPAYQPAPQSVGYPAQSVGYPAQYAGYPAQSVGYPTQIAPQLQYL
jgi:hypothetical protein